MFSFLQDFGNYEQRKIDRYEKNGLIVDTAAVSDGVHPYETGVCHPEYNLGKWVIVQAYDTQEESYTGHDTWIKRMTTEPLPEYLRDCANAIVSSMLESTSEDAMLFPRRR